jgi:phage I-like protein
MPAGRFKARDGRPAGLQGWNLTDDLANKLISTATRQQDRFLIDYDHQTINAPANGGKAPAAGWFSRLAWRPGDGLYATGVEWTLPAQKAISAREYRYISPVLTYDATTGDVTGLLMAAIVNYPALDGLTDLAVAASARFGRTTTPTLNATEIYARRKPA